MTVIILENSSERLRGLLTRWLLEVKPGVFVGKISYTVRVRLWKKVQEEKVMGGLLIYSANTEQGYDIEMFGSLYRSVIDLNGVKVISIRKE